MLLVLMSSHGTTLWQRPGGRTLFAFQTHHTRHDRILLSRSPMDHGAMLWLRRLETEPFPDPLEEPFPDTLQASGKHVIRKDQRFVVVGQPMGGVSRQFLLKF